MPEEIKHEERLNVSWSLQRKVLLSNNFYEENFICN